MKITPQVKEILSKYEGETPQVKENLARILMQGKLGGTGKLVILPVDQGMEHGPDASFGPNPPAYDPHYHYKLAIDAGLSAYASTFGMLQAGVDTFRGQIPTILKVNSSNLLYNGTPDQAITASVKDADRLGCSAIGFTIYPGSDRSINQFEEIRKMSEEARSLGMAVVIWSYARGGILTKDTETAIDVISYAAHIAASLGAHIIKVKPPTAVLGVDKAKKVMEKQDFSTLAKRIAHIKKACFDGRRIVVFSGGDAKDSASLLNEIKEIRDGGGNGSIIGRNAFQRPRAEALQLLNDITDIYLGKK
jgi:fructose-bisphosphate aldolase, class I